MLPLRYIDCPKFRGTFLRRTTPQLMKSGNLWDKAHDIYGQLEAKYKPRFLKGEQKIAIFPHGPKIEYSHMQLVSDKENFQGAEMTMFGVDEALQFEWEQISYLFSRMRSNSKYPSRLIMSGNPDPDHEIAKMIEWYLDDEGYPHPEREGLIRYFLTINGEFVWSSSKQKLINQFKTKHYNPKPLSFSFLSSTIYDNPICMQQNPGYVSFLEGLGDVEKARLLYGNWKIRPEGANYFKREDLQKADRVPLGALAARGWDKASTEPHDINKYPDYTACCKMYKDRDGNFYISGEYHHANHDVDSDVFGKFRKKPGARDNIILKQSIYDGEDCMVILPIDAGAAGRTEFVESSKKLSREGFRVKKDPAVNGTSKLQKFSPFSGAVENGFVYIVESTFPNKATLESFYKDLESFDGEKSGKLKKDDIADSVATVFNHLNQSRVVPIVCRNQVDNPTKTKKVIEARHV